MTTGNLVLLQRAYRAFNTGNVEGVVALTAEDVEWGTTALFPGMAPMYRGHRGMAMWIDEVRAPWRSFEVAADEVLIDEPGLLGVVEHMRGRGRESDAAVELRAWTLYEVRGGRMIRRRAFADEASFRQAAAGR